MNIYHVESQNEIYASITLKIISDTIINVLTTKYGPYESGGTLINLDDIKSKHGRLPAYNIGLIFDGNAVRVNKFGSAYEPLMIAPIKIIIPSDLDDFSKAAIFVYGKEDCKVNVTGKNDEIILVPFIDEDQATHFWKESNVTYEITGPNQLSVNGIQDYIVTFKNSTGFIPANGKIQLQSSAGYLPYNEIEMKGRSSVKCSVRALDLAPNDDIVLSCRVRNKYMRSTNGKYFTIKVVE